MTRVLINCHVDSVLIFIVVLTLVDLGPNINWHVDLGPYVNCHVDSGPNINCQVDSGPNKLSCCLGPNINCRVDSC